MRREFLRLTTREVHEQLDAKLRSDEWKLNSDVTFWAVFPSCVIIHFCSLSVVQ